MYALKEETLMGVLNTYINNRKFSLAMYILVRYVKGKRKSENTCTSIRAGG